MVHGCLIRTWLDTGYINLLTSKASVVLISLCWFHAYLFRPRPNGDGTSPLRGRKVTIYGFCGSCCYLRLNRDCRLLIEDSMMIPVSLCKHRTHRIHVVWSSLGRLRGSCGYVRLNRDYRLLIEDSMMMPVSLSKLTAYRLLWIQSSLAGLRFPSASDISQHGGNTPVMYEPQVAATRLVLGEP